MDSTQATYLYSGSSSIANEVDALFSFLVYSSIVFLGIVVFGVIYLSLRYRHREGTEKETTSGVDHSLKLELAWSIIPTILVMIVFVWGFNVYLKMNVVPKDALEIKVTGQKWFWSFDYNEGINVVNELVAPVGKPIKLLMSSRDVIHSFYVPDFRIKMDVLPNRYTIVWFEATKVGSYNLFCAEFCGDSHSGMIGKVRIVTEKEYNEWLETSVLANENMSPVELGASLFVQKACVTCHSVEGKKLTGPHLNGKFGTEDNLADGSKILIDENYIRESILDPQAKIVAGYQPVMPTYQGILKDRQIDALIAYLKSIK